MLNKTIQLIIFYYFSRKKNFKLKKVIQLNFDNYVKKESHYKQISAFNLCDLSLR